MTQDKRHNQVGTFIVRYHSVSLPGVLRATQDLGEHGGGGLFGSSVLPSHRLYQGPNQHGGVKLIAVPFSKTL